jgi:hypothetical protein
MGNRSSHQADHRRPARHRTASASWARLAVVGGGDHGSLLVGLAAFAVFTVFCVLLAFSANGAGAQGSNPFAKCNKYKPNTQPWANCHLRVQTELTRCKKFPFAPCLGTVDSMYAMTGAGFGDTKLIKATRSAPGTERIMPEGTLETQAFAWKSVSNVKIVAAYIVHKGIYRSTYQRIPTGSHSGQVTLKWLHQAARIRTGPDPNPPELLLEGEEIHKKPVRKKHH